jgi:decaprenyl-phosphate phosphoribosyltransferase
MSKIKSILRLMRIHQYVKNAFIFLPLFFAGQITNIVLFSSALVGFIGFSIAASAVYILNDFLDIEDDRKHPSKKDRPLASGLISKKESLVLIGLFSSIGLTIMATQSIQALVILLSYIVLNIGYSFYLKHIPVIDIAIISIGFVLRLFIGAIVTVTPLSKWIVIMTFLLALFLALAKRRDDVIHFMNTGKKMRKVIDGYNLQLIDGAMTIMASVVIVSYLLYTTSIEVINRINSEYLYLTSFFVILGVLRYMQISFVENNSGSPTKILYKDKFMLINILVWVFSFIYIIYFNE